MQIANPIYDVVFKYLMEDSKIAKLLISTIIEEEIISLDLRPHEGTVELDHRTLTVYRLDFSAKIKTPEGYRLVLIEIQKAKFATDIMRFRKYLGTQYENPENVQNVNLNGREIKTGIPILSIYFLGYKLGHTDAPLIKVKRHYYDVRTGKEIKEKIEFIESLTHDSFIIQISHLRKKYQTEAEQLLSVFDQHNITSDYHILNVREEDLPEKYRPVMRRLLRAVAEPQIRKTMDIEDEILEELQDKEREIARKDKAIEEKDKAIEKNRKAIEEKNKTIEEKDKAIEEKDKAIEEKDKAIEDKKSEIERQRKEIEEFRKKFGEIDR